MPLQPSEDTFYIKQGNTVPILQAQLTDEDDVPLDLQFAEDVLFRMYDPRSGDTLFLRDAVIQNEQNGVVQYVWRNEDTQEPGRYRSEFVVRYPSDKEESFPNFGYRDVLVWGTEKNPPVGNAVETTYPVGD